MKEVSIAALVERHVSYRGVINAYLAGKLSPDEAATVEEACTMGELMIVAVVRAESVKIRATIKGEAVIG